MHCGGRKTSLVLQQVVLCRVAAVKCLAYITIVHVIYFLVLLDHWAYSESV